LEDSRGEEAEVEAEEGQVLAMGEVLILLDQRIHHKLTWTKIWKPTWRRARKSKQRSRKLRFLLPQRKKKQPWPISKPNMVMKTRATMAKWTCFLRLECSQIKNSGHDYWTESERRSKSNL